MTKKASKKIQDEVFPGFTERSDRGRKNRETGVKFERAIAKKLRVLWPGARREHGQARDGNEVPDVGGTPFWVECSDGATRQIYAKLCQAIEDAKTTPNMIYQGKTPLVISHHKARGLTMVTMTLDDWVRLLREIEE